MRIYLSGPITSLPDSNVPKFNSVAERLRAEGHFVINPAELSTMFGTAEAIARSFECLYDNEDGSKCHAYYYIKLACAVMDADLAAVRSCDAICLLRGWETSRGAKKELAEAIKCGLEVRQEGGEE